MALPTIRDALRAGRIGWWAAKFDLKDGFFHLPIHADFVDLFGIVHPSTGTFARYRCLCFGMKCAPFFFQGLTVELRRILLLHNIGCEVLVYIDDFLLLGPSREIIERAMATFVRIIGTEMRFLIHHDKTVYPTQLIPWGGMLIDFKHGTLQCAPDKAERTGSLAAALLSSQDKVHYTLADTLVGKLTFLSTLFLGATRAIAPLRDDLSAVRHTWGKGVTKAPPYQKMDLSDAARRALSWWCHQLTNLPAPRRLFVFSDGTLDLWDRHTFTSFSCPPDGCLVITSDASACGFAFFTGALSSPRLLCAGTWTPEQSVNTSNWRELYTLYLALNAYAKHFNNLVRKIK